MLLTRAENLKMDALLDCLVLFTKLYHKPFSAEALTAGLPIEPGSDAPELFSIDNAKGLFSRAAEKAGLRVDIVAQENTIRGLVEAMEEYYRPDKADRRRST